MMVEKILRVKDEMKDSFHCSKGVQSAAPQTIITSLLRNPLQTKFYVAPAFASTKTNTLLVSSIHHGIHNPLL